MVLDYLRQQGAQSVDIHTIVRNQKLGTLLEERPGAASRILGRPTTVSMAMKEQFGSDYVWVFDFQVNLGQ